jgi:hypothetical protein
VRSQWPGEPDQPHHTPAPGAPPLDPFPRRWTDRVERVAGGLVGFGALALVVAAVLAGLALHGSGLRQAANDAVDRIQVPATLTAAAEVPIGVDQSGATATGTTPATWTGPDGSAHTGRIPVLAPQPAGSTVSMWVDRQGAPAAPPVDRTQAAVTAVVGAVLVLLAGGLLLAGVRALVRSRCAAANHRAWAREWTFYEPLWSSRS